MNKLPHDKRIAILKALAEGCSMRSRARLVGCSINTVVGMLIAAGKACAKYQHDNMRDLACRRLQLDEIWSFCYAKQKNVPAEHQGELGFGDVWTWTAICAETKLVPCWLLGWRDACFATAFVDDLGERLAGRVQITTDGLKAYIDAIDGAFGGGVDYAMLIKLFGGGGSNHNPETRYSPAECCGTKHKKISGNPDKAHVSTSYAERQNLTMRMRMRRFTRLTNGFSKKLERMEYAVAMYFMVYNYVTPHQTLTENANGRETTPAMAARVADHVWSYEDLLAMIERLSEAENSK
jgi:IS1 family transposase